MRTLADMVLKTLEVAAESSNEDLTVWMDINTVTQRVLNTRRAKARRQIAARLRSLERTGVVERRRFGRGFVGWRLRVDK